MSVSALFLLVLTLLALKSYDVYADDDLAETFPDSFIEIERTIEVEHGPDRSGRPDLLERPYRPERPDRPARPDRPERPDRPARPDHPGRPCDFKKCKRPNIRDDHCPSFYGTFPDKEDCSYFYSCARGRETRQKCPPFTGFDKNSRRCISDLIAVCEGAKITTDQPKTTATRSTSKDVEFRCPSLFGSYFHPTDCSKYYKCDSLVPSLMTCPQSELFDGVKNECRPATTVHCGYRIRPRDPTERVTITTPNLITTTTTKIPETTTPELTTPSETVTTATTTVVTTRPTGPPDTDCNEEDLDCIITDTGEKPEWFECPESIGSYAHPSSQKLFIFCLNWKPSVKKCGNDLVYSDDYGTCVGPQEGY